MRRRKDQMIPVLPVTRMVIVQLHVANPRRWWMMWRTSAVWKRGWTAKELSTYATRNETLGLIMRVVTLSRDR